MKNESDHPAVTLAKSEFGLIERCRCNGYHVSLRNIMLHYNRAEFTALADLFREAKEREEEIFLFSEEKEV